MPHVRVITGLDGYRVHMPDRDTFQLTPIRWFADMGVTAGTADLTPSGPTATINEFQTRTASMNEAAANAGTAMDAAKPYVEKALNGDANALQNLLKRHPFAWHFPFVQEAAKRLIERGATASPKMGRPQGIGHTPTGEPLPHIALLMLVRLIAYKRGSLEVAFDEVAAYLGCTREHIRATFFRERKQMRDDPFLKAMVFDTAPPFRIGLKDYARVVGATIRPLKDFEQTTERGMTTRYFKGQLALVSPDYLRHLPRRAFRMATKTEIRAYWAV